MSRAAIIGAGKTGGGWAARFLLMGWDVTVFDPDPAAERKLAAILDRARRSLPMLYERRLPEAGALRFADSVAAAVAGADHVQESVPDRLELKQEALGQIGAAGADCPIASSTARFRPGELGAGMALPERLVVTRPLAPLYLLPLVELVSGAASGATIRGVTETFRRLGMSAVSDAGETGALLRLAGAADGVSGRRDRTLVALLRALKADGTGAGQVIAEHEAWLPLADGAAVPLVTVERMIPSDWTDYNGHMNESRYGQIWSDAADAVMLHVGAGADYVARGMSYFTVETKTKFILETLAGEMVRCETRVTLAEGRKLAMSHVMKRVPDGEVLATCDQFMLHVSLETRRSCAPDPQVLARVEALAEAHA
ncbi:MAG: thioesterase family protein [Silicimonas sp.]|nr:thioesterase family protein [Silicimonas sp.]